LLLRVGDLVVEIHRDLDLTLDLSRHAVHEVTKGEHASEEEQRHARREDRGGGHQLVATKVRRRFANEVADLERHIQSRGP
jgi:hypothetical protein